MLNKKYFLGKDKIMVTKELFESYHEENPEIYNLFERFTLEAIASGRKYFGSKAIIERLRWHSLVEAKLDIFKINNNYAPFYARMFEQINPQHKGFFRKRRAVADVWLL